MIARNVSPTEQQLSPDGALLSVSEFALQLRWRLLLAAAFFAMDSAFVAFGGGTSSLIVLLSYAPYILLVVGVRLTLSHIRSRRLLLAMVVSAFIIDFLFIALQLHLSGGGWWHGATFSVLVVMIAASTVPPRALTIITALGAMIYVGKGWLEVTGRLPTPVWGTFPRPDGNVEFLWNYAAFGALGLAAAALTQSRLVQRIGDVQARLRTVVDASPYLVMTIDERGIISAASRASVRVTGFDPEQLIGSPMSLLIHHSESAALEQALERARSGDRFRCELRGTAAGGGERWYGIGLSHIATKRPTNEVVVMVRDMTDDHRQAEERRALAGEREEARRLELVGRLVSGVAHELNNPLSAILTLAEQMEQEEKTSNDSSDARIIHEQARRARAIVRDLLQVVRAPAKNTMQLEDVNHAVQRVLSAVMTRPDAGQRRLRTSLYAEVALFRGEEGAIDQVLTNLIVNALQATAENGCIELVVTANESRVRVVVRDDGPGFDDALLSQLFEPFFTTRAPGHGTGLGLAVSRAIVERHGGSLVAESMRSEGGGAQFTVDLPRAYADSVNVLAVPAVDMMPAVSSGDMEIFASTQRENATEGEGPTATTHAGIAPRQVLIVDDESSIRLALSRWFVRRGWTVSQCEDGAKALATLRDATTTFDLILCDLKMPGKSGLAVYSALESEYPELLERFVITTGDVASADVAAFLANVRVPVLEKPFALGQLSDVIALIAPDSASVPTEPHAVEAR